MLESLWITFVTIGLAELGDKTQLLVLSMAMKGKFWVVLGGALSAFLLLTVLAATLGSLLASVLPLEYVETGAAIVFILLGLWMLYKTLRKEEEEEENAGNMSFWSVFSLMFIAELGDKTQIATLGMAARFPSFPIMVFLGSFLGLALVTLIGIIIGRTAAEHIPRKLISLIASVFFIAFGILSLLNIV